MSATELSTLQGEAAQADAALSADTARLAAGSSFYAGMRVLPKPEREGMYAVYAFCRIVDDIADDMAGARPERTAALDAWRRDLDRLYAGGDPGRALVVEEAVRRFHLAREDFEAVIDGMQMDVDADIRAPSLAVQDLYCDRVAAAVGRLSVRIFGMDEGPGHGLAHHLGRALQLTNILRDLDEDAGIGRLYLAREDLDAAGITGDDPLAVVADPLVDAAARATAARAHAHYREAAAILRKRPRGKLIAPRLMEAVYSRTLARTEAQGWVPPRTRVKVGKAELGWLVLTKGVFG